MLMTMMGGGAGGGGVQRWGIASYGAGGDQYPAQTNVNIGWVFTPVENIYCNALRANAVATPAAVWRVNIYRNSDGLVIATADISISESDVWTSALVGEYLLQNGVAYTISARTTNGSSYYRRNNSYAYSTGFNASSTGSVTGETASRPTTQSSNTYRGMDFGYI